MSIKTDIRAKVVSNTAIGPCFYCLTLEPLADYQKIIAKTLPGQFCQVQIENLSSPQDSKFPSKQSILRKPFSFSALDIDNKGIIRLKILYCVLGSGTEKMTTLAPGDDLNFLAPLGNSFNISDDLETAILVAGGMGAAPLQYLTQYLQRKHPEKKIIAFIGARAVKGLPFFHTHDHLEKGKIITEIEEFAQYGAKTYISTDDGTAGFKGFVTELMDQTLLKLGINKDKSMIYTCGPELMMHAVADFAHKNDYKCQVSLERMMACGIGLCQSCAVECNQTGSDDTIYRLCCKDGPIFNSQEVHWK